MSKISLLNLVKEHIKEAKQVGFLYHYTSPETLKKIEECDCLKAGLAMPTSLPGSPRKTSHKLDSSKGISTTRNKNLHKLDYFTSLELGLDEFDTPFIRLTLDGDLISQRYETKPFRYYFTDISPVKPRKDEFEERIMTEHIPNLSRYLVRVDNIIDEIPGYADANKVDGEDDWEDDQVDWDNDQVLSEIGEGSAPPYEYRVENFEDKGQALWIVYRIRIAETSEYVGRVKLWVAPDHDRQVLEIDFDVLPTNIADYDINKPNYKVTNLGIKVMTRILSTIIHIIETDLRARITKPIDVVMFLTVEGKASKSDNRYKGNEQRARLYDAYIRKHLDIESVSNYHSFKLVYTLATPIEPL